MACVMSAPSNAHGGITHELYPVTTTSPEKEHELRRPAGDEINNKTKTRPQASENRSQCTRKSTPVHPKRASYIPSYVKPLIEGRVCETSRTNKPVGNKEVVNGKPKSILKQRPRSESCAKAGYGRSLSVDRVSLNKSERQRLESAALQGKLIGK